MLFIKNTHFTLYIIAHETRYCSRCDATQTCTIVRSGHDHSVKIGTVVATCVRDGGTQYQCSVCGETYLDVTVPALGHFFDDGEYLDCGIRESDVPFDLDLDCQITANDIVTLKQILLGGAKTDCDPNGDGVVDVRDLVALKN